MHTPHAVLLCTMRQSIHVSRQPTWKPAATGLLL